MNIYVRFMNIHEHICSFYEHTRTYMFVLWTYTNIHEHICSFYEHTRTYMFVLRTYMNIYVRFLNIRVVRLLRQLKLLANAQILDPSDLVLRSPAQLLLSLASFNTCRHYESNSLVVVRVEIATRPILRRLKTNLMVSKMLKFVMSWIRFVSGLILVSTHWIQTSGFTTFASATTAYFLEPPLPQLPNCVAISKNASVPIGKIKSRPRLVTNSFIYALFSFFSWSSFLISLEL